MKSFLIVVIVSLVLSSCSFTVPSEDLKSADYGPPQSVSEAQKKAANHFRQILIDPDSMKLQCSDDVRRGWARDNMYDEPTYGYLVLCRVNAKNRLGGYTGASDYAVVINGSSAFAVEMNRSDNQRRNPGRWMGYAENKNSTRSTKENIGDEDEALTALLSAAEQGDAKAQVSLGSRYIEGKGVSKNLVQGEAWIRKAVEQDDAMGQAILGAMYYEGIGVPKDLAQAESLIRKAAERGVPSAQSALSLMYFKGEGVPQDTVQAAAWIRKAAEQGFAVSQFDLGLLYREGMGGVPKDDIQSYKWFTLAAESGDQRGEEHRRIVAKRMTFDQIDEAQKLVREWKPTPSQYPLH